MAKRATTPPARGSWAGKMGFIMAAAGSAVGLGNLWKFPWMAYKNGGYGEAEPYGAGAFVLIYLLSVVVVGLPVMIAEIVIGRRSGKDPVGAFEALRPGSLWKWVGALGVLTGFLLLSYYGVVAGWTAFFLLKSVTGSLTVTPDAGKEIFAQFTASAPMQVAWMAIFVLLTAAVVIGGISKGIERVTKILMPGLLIMVFWLFFMVMGRENASSAYAYMFYPDFSHVTASLVLDAMGQAFFSLSLGMGAVITYGSYLGKKDRIVTCAVSVTFLDTLVALVASLVIFGVLFHLNLQTPGDGQGNLFTAIPAIFSQLEGGTTLVIVFFLLVTFAALTSTVSLLEVVVSYFIDERGWSRKAAVVKVSAAVFLLGIPSAFSFNVLGDTKVFGMTFFALFDYLCANWTLPIGGLLITIFAGWILTSKETEDEINTHRPIHAFWKFCVRYIAPIVVLLVLVGIIAGVGGSE